MQDTLAQLSDALVERAAVAQGFVIGIRGTQFQPRSGTLWRADVAVASEQVAPKTEEAEIVLADGRVAQARVAGRDRGTNVVAFRLQQPVEVELPAAVEPRLGAFALVFGADGGGGTIVRMGVVRALGPAWHSLGGGRIDHRISLDLTISSAEEEGPVLDASGGLLGMSTAGPRVPPDRSSWGSPLAQGRGLKHRRNAVSEFSRHVASRAGAWIETVAWAAECGKPMSPLAQGRGLKPLNVNAMATEMSSPLAQGRGLKHQCRRTGAGRESRLSRRGVD